MDRKTESTTPESSVTPQPDARKLFGDMLRSAREVAGYSIEQLAEATRISHVFISALESGSFEKLPGPVFGRGFIRSLCKALDVDSQDFVAAFQLALTQQNQPTETLLKVPGEGPAAVRLRSEEASNTEKVRSFFRAVTPSRAFLAELPIMPVLAGTVAVFLVPGILWIFAGKERQTVHKTPAKTEQISQEKTELRPIESSTTVSEVAPISPKETVAAPKTEPVVESKPVAAAPAPAAAAAIPPAPPALLEDDPELRSQQLEFAADPSVGRGGQSLIITVHEEVKVRMNVDNAGWTTETLSPKKYTYKFDDNAQLLVYDAGVVEISFNGRSLGSLGRRGRIRRLSFAAEGTRTNF